MPVQQVHIEMIATGDNSAGVAVKVYIGETDVTSTITGTVYLIIDSYVLVSQNGGLTYVSKRTVGATVPGDYIAHAYLAAGGGIAKSYTEGKRTICLPGVVPVVVGASTGYTSFVAEGELVS